LEGVTNVITAAAAAEPTKKAKETMKFIVTSNLEVHESSSIKTFELITARGSNLIGFKTQLVVVTPRHLHSMLRSALLGSAAILDDIFPVVEEDDAGSIATETSFNLVYDTEQAAAVTSSKWSCESCPQTFESDHTLVFAQENLA
jgi:hypothetical protein